LSFFRTSFFMAIVSVLVITGYAFDVLDYDCHGEQQEQTTHGHAPSGKDAPAEKGNCQCLCHQIFTIQMTAPVCVLCDAPRNVDYLVLRDEFPPDAVPLGIDHPPQIA
jgi:hypothetical protein